MNGDLRTLAAVYGALVVAVFAYAAALWGLTPYVLLSTATAAGLVGVAGLFAAVGLRSDRRVVDLSFPLALTVALAAAGLAWGLSWSLGFLGASDPSLHAAVVGLGAAPWLGLALGSARRPREEWTAAGLVAAAAATLVLSSVATLRSPPFDDPPFLLAFQTVLWLLAALVGAGLYGLSRSPARSGDPRAVELAALAPAAGLLVALAVVRSLGAALVRMPPGLLIALVAAGLFPAVVALLARRRL